MPGYSDYRNLMVSFATKHQSPLWDDIQKDAPLTKPPNYETYKTIFFGFMEIENTFNALELTEILVSIAPPRSKRINKDEYIKYLVNTYLQEIYILKERLNAYAKKLKRLYNRFGRQALVSKYIDPIIFRSVDATLGGIIKTRGEHVHLNRYSDDKLDKISQLALMSKYDQSLKPLYKSSYKAIQVLWTSRIKTNNKETLRLLDQYFDNIAQVIKENGVVYIPKQK